MAARTNITRSMLLGTTAIATLGLAACNSDNDFIATPAAVEGPFGIVVGEPVAVISATRGQGASVDFDQFTVTFNNAEGTSITIGTPEGESITFDRDDPATWVGSDDELGGLELARLVSDDGDRLEVFIGEVRVPVEPPVQTGTLAQPPAIPKEDQLAFAAARLDENDTRDGFETYAVTGDLTDPDDLPRHTADVFQDVEGVPVLVNAEGDLIDGTASYQGNFLASVFRDGQIISDAVTGSSTVQIDFAGNTVDIKIDGDYEFDDLDDTELGAVTGLLVTYTDGVVTGVEPVRSGVTNPDKIVTAIQVIREPVIVPLPGPLATAALVTPVPVLGDIIDVQPIFGDPITATNIVTSLNVSFSTLPADVEGGNGLTVVSEVEVVRADDENDDTYDVKLFGTGGPDDINFDSGVQYTGALGVVGTNVSFVEVPIDSGNGTASFDVTGEFGGAVFGPGASAFDVLDTVDTEFLPSEDQIIDATGTAGVFEANSNPDPLDDNATVEIVGVFAADSEGFD